MIPPYLITVILEILIWIVCLAAYVLVFWIIPWAIDLDFYKRRGIEKLLPAMWSHIIALIMATICFSVYWFGMDGKEDYQVKYNKELIQNR